jgi:prevent-host-death family protein
MARRASRVATGTSGRKADKGLRRVDLVHHLVDVGRVLTYNIHEAKTHFSRLLARVAAGEEVLITKAGEPIAKIVPVRARTRRIPDARPAGLWLAEDFDAELPPELLDDFSGGR